MNAGPASPVISQLADWPDEAAGTNVQAGCWTQGGDVIPTWRHPLLFYCFFQSAMRCCFSSLP